MDVAKIISVIFDNLLEPFKRIDRLVTKFKLDLLILPFWRIYEKDENLLDLQQKLNDGCIHYQTHLYRFHRFNHNDTFHF